MNKLLTKRGTWVAIGGTAAASALLLGLPGMVSGERAASGSAATASAAAGVQAGAAQKAPVSAVVKQTLQQGAYGDVQVSEDSATGGTSMVRVGPGGDLYPQAPSNIAAEAKVARFLEAHGNLFGISDSRSQLKLTSVRKDQYGHSRVSYQQMHDGVPVLGAQLLGHVSADGRLTAVNGKFISDIDLPARPVVAKTDAQLAAVTNVSQQLPSALKGTELVAKSTKLVVYRTGLTNAVAGDNHLAYEVQVAGGGHTREFVYIDALTGKIVDKVTGIHSAAKNRELYQGTYNPALPPAWKEGDLRPDPSPTHEDEISGTGYTYNLFWNLSNGTYDSWDGFGAKMITVDTDPTIVCPNANWNGTSTNYCVATASDDVVAHEWTHAYTQETSGLIYAYQSGALNESYSDIFGEVVDLLNNRDTLSGASLPGANDGPRSQDDTVCSTHTREIPTADNSVRWLIGEDALAFAGLPPFGDAAIRDMWRPRCAGGNVFLGDPGHATSNRYHCSASDAGGVHVNSSIPNRAFALLVDGDTVTHKDNNTLFESPVTVTGIGLTKASHIYWRANSTYNLPATNFKENADNLVQACMDLVGMPLTKLVTNPEKVSVFPMPGNNDTIHPTPETWDGVETWGGQTRNYSATISAADCVQVENAIAAVEMRHDVTKQCGFKAPLDPAPAPMCNGATVKRVFSEDWESGVPAGWTIGQDPLTKSQLDTKPWFLRTGDLPKGRPGSAMYQENRKDLGNCSTDDESGVLYLISPEITLTGDGPSFLIFDHYFRTEAFYDGGNVLASINGGPFTPIPLLAYELIPGSAFVHNPYNGTLNDATDQNTNPKGGEPAFFGSNPITGTNEWGQSQIDLSKIGAEKDDKVRIRWDFGQDGCNGVDGWYVDRVEVFSCGDDVPPPPRECREYPASITGVSPISAVATSVTTANVSGATGPIEDVNIRNLEGLHTYMGDLKFSLKSPAGTSITLFDGAACAGEDGISAEFDDGADTVIACSDWTSGGTFRPHQALAAFNGQDPNGNWTLTVEDGFLQDEGFIESWSVELCRDVPPPPPPTDDGHKTTGGGWLADVSGGKINFGFNAKQKENGASGNLQLNDKGRDVKIHLKTVTSIGAVQEMCGAIGPGPKTMEFRGTGTYNGADGASFRVCVEDNGEPGNSASSATPDRFYLACTTGCTYSTASFAADDRIDGGNLQVHQAKAPAPESSAQSSGASTLILNPVLMSEGLAGSLQLFEVQVYGASQQPLAGQNVSLTRTAGGVTQTLNAVSSLGGKAVFSVTLPTANAEFLASSGSAGSNAVSVKPMLAGN